MTHALLFAIAIITYETTKQLVGRWLKRRQDAKAASEDG